MMTGELVLPLVIVGITEASTTRRPAMPCTRRRASTTAVGSLASPIFAVPTGWKIVVAISPALTARSASLTNCAPGLNSSGRNGAIAGRATMSRVNRIDCAAMARSPGVDR